LTRPTINAASTVGTSQYKPPPAWASRVPPATTRQPQLITGDARATIQVSGVSRSHRGDRALIQSCIPDSDPGDQQLPRHDGGALPGTTRNRPVISGVVKRISVCAAAVIARAKPAPSPAT
jgi:hypothetical protein